MALPEIESYEQWLRDMMTMMVDVSEKKQPERAQIRILLQWVHNQNTRLDNAAKTIDEQKTKSWITAKDLLLTKLRAKKCREEEKKRKLKAKKLIHEKNVRIKEVKTELSNTTKDLYLTKLRVTQNAKKRREKEKKRNLKAEKLIHEKDDRIEAQKQWLHQKEVIIGKQKTLIKKMSAMMHIKNAKYQLLEKQYKNMIEWKDMQYQSLQKEAIALKIAETTLNNSMKSLRSKLEKLQKKSNRMWYPQCHRKSQDLRNVKFYC